MDPSISSNYIEVDKVNIHYLAAGSGETILLLHGWPTSAYLWRNVLPGLAKNNRVIAMDLPGFGKSDKRLEGSFSFRYYSRLISGFLDQLEIDTITLGVHDFGGPLGLYWATQNMKQVQKLILFNTLVYPQFSWAVKLFGLATVVPGVKQWLTSPKGLKAVMRFGVYNKNLLTDEIIENYQSPFKDSTSRKVLLKSVQRLSLKGFKEIAEKLPTFECPVQIIYGEKDKILPEVAKTMSRVKRDVPQASLTSIANCGHFLQEEVSDEIVRVVSLFMSKPY